MSNPVSLPYIEMTLQVMAQFGVRAHRTVPCFSAAIAVPVVRALMNECCVGRKFVSHSARSVSQSGRLRRRVGRLLRVVPARHGCHHRYVHPNHY
jgi:hypothetical protein